MCNSLPAPVVSSCASTSAPFKCPRTLPNADDFYLSDSGLLVLETTDHIFDFTVYKALVPETLPSWQRVRSAILLASTGEEWLRVFK